MTNDDKEKIDRLQSALSTAEMDLDDAERKVVALVQAIDQAEDWDDLHARVDAITGLGPVGHFWPSWRQ
jgi:hypothetical protein